MAQKTGSQAEGGLFYMLKQVLKSEKGAKETSVKKALQPQKQTDAGASPGNERDTKLASLTKRERELLLLLLEGCTLKEAAGALSVQYSTANTHMTSLYKKLGVNSRPELIIQYRDYCVKKDQLS